MREGQLKTERSAFSILIASEDIDFHLHFAHVFEAKGLMPFFAIDLEQTLRFAREERPHAILLDCSLKAEACERLKQDPKTTSIPVFILVNPRVEQDILRLVNAGAERLFFKPSMPARLRGYG
jgi:CheY-like chemotaxis protein